MGALGMIKKIIDIHIKKIRWNLSFSVLDCLEYKLYTGSSFLFSNLHMYK